MQTQLAKGHLVQTQLAKGHLVQTQLAKGHLVQSQHLVQSPTCYSFPDHCCSLWVVVRPRCLAILAKAGGGG